MHPDWIRLCNFGPDHSGTTISVISPASTESGMRTVWKLPDPAMLPPATSAHCPSSPLRTTSRETGPPVPESNARMAGAGKLDHKHRRRSRAPVRAAPASCAAGEGSTAASARGRTEAEMAIVLLEVGPSRPLDVGAAAAWLSTSHQAKVRIAAAPDRKCAASFTRSRIDRVRSLGKGVSRGS